MNLNNSQIMELYKGAIEEEHFFLNAHETRVKFWLGILTTLYAGTVLGIFQSKIWYQFALASLGPIMIIIVSALAEEGLLRVYRRFLDAVMVRAKLEQRLSLTQSLPKTLQSSYWSAEPIISQIHLDARSEFNSSQEFFNSRLKEGYNRITTQLIRRSRTLGIILLITTIALSVSSWLKWI